MRNLAEVQKRISTCPEERRFGLETDCVEKKKCGFISLQAWRDPKVRFYVRHSSHNPIVPHSAWPSTCGGLGVRTLHCRESTKWPVRMERGR